MVHKTYHVLYFRPGAAEARRIEMPLLSLGQVGKDFDWFLIEIPFLKKKEKQCKIRTIAHFVYICSAHLMVFSFC